MLADYLLFCLLHGFLHLTSHPGYLHYVPRQGVWKLSFFVFCKVGLEGNKRKFINKETATYRFFQFNSVVFSYAYHFVVLDSWHAKMKKEKRKKKS